MPEDELEEVAAQEEELEPEIPQEVVPETTEE